MSNLFIARLAAAAGVVALAAGTSQAVLFGWNYTKGQPGQGSQYERSDAGGTVESINSTFDSSTKRLTFDVLFSGANNTASPLVTNGFWLVVDNGPNPKTHSGELSILYFDASRVFAGTASAPTLTSYEYNGVNANTSWRDGNGDGTTDGGDLIKGANDAAGFIFNASAGTQTIAGQTYRRLTFDINATDIIGHTPLFPVAGTDWYGTGFDDHLGIWFHPAQIFNASYDAGGHGGITALSTASEGWLDGQNFTTTRIPGPASATLLGLGGLIAARRRRA
jgi:hypothetical protein